MKKINFLKDIEFLPNALKQTFILSNNKLINNSLHPDILKSIGNIQ